MVPFVREQFEIKHGVPTADYEAARLNPLATKCSQMHAGLSTKKSAKIKNRASMKEITFEENRI